MSKTMTMDSPEFREVYDASEELGRMIVAFMVEKSVNIPHALAIMASSTIDVIRTIAHAIDEDPAEMMETYIGGLQTGFKEEMRVLNEKESEESVKSE